MKTPKRYKNASLAKLPPAVIKALHMPEGSQKKSFYIFGEVGTGKTYAAWAFAQQFPVDKYRVVNVPNMLTSFRPGNFDKVESESIEEIAEFGGYLVLDDLGVEKMSEWVGEMLYMIINFRYENMLPMVVTSNLSLGEMSNHLGDRITSRLAEMCEMVELDGKDLRIN